MTTSGSMPFSFASASIVCCSGLLMFSAYRSSELDFQIGPCDHTERHAMGPPIVAVDQDLVALQPGETTFEESLAVHRLAHHDLGAASGKAAVILDAPE